MQDQGTSRPSVAQQVSCAVVSRGRRLDFVLELTGLSAVASRKQSVGECAVATRNRAVAGQGWDEGCVRLREQWRCGARTTGLWHCDTASLGANNGEPHPARLDSLGSTDLRVHGEIGVECAKGEERVKSQAP